MGLVDISISGISYSALTLIATAFSEILRIQTKEQGPFVVVGEGRRVICPLLPSFYLLTKDLT